MTVILHLPVLKYDFDFDMWYDFGEDDDDADDSLLFLHAGRQFGSVQLITNKNRVLRPADKKRFHKMYLLNSRKHDLQVI